MKNEKGADFTVCPFGLNTPVQSPARAIRSHEQTAHHQPKRH
jgi:hypothetical protein